MMSNWARLKSNAAKLGFDFRHDELVISNAEFMRCLNILSQHIPDERLVKDTDPGEFDFIRGWTDQILNATRKELLVAVAVITATAHAYEAVAELPGAQHLISEIPKHQARGLFDQLLITYYLSKYINVTAVEQDNKRVDIVAEIADEKINIHVKGTDPHTKDQAQFEALGHLTQARLRKPIIDKDGKKLEIVSFDGYIPVGVPKDFWNTVWDKVLTKPVTSLEITVPGGGKEPDSTVALSFSWKSERNGLRGAIKGVNAFQNAIHRVNDVDGKIPSSSHDIELAVLVNDSAKHLQLGSGVLPNRRLDGIIAIAVNPGSLGYHFDRSKLYLKTEHKEVAAIVDQALPQSIWLC